MKSFKNIFLASVLLVFAGGANAALMLSPGGEILSGPETSQNAIDTVIAGTLGTSIELYKDNVGGSEEGAAAGWYTTLFSNTATDPSDATITHDGPGVITDATHLLVKDGNQVPAWYLFDISGWNGTETIELSAFWPNQGAISHVSIYGGGNGDAPEPSIIALFGLGLVGLGFARRRRTM